MKLFRAEPVTESLLRGDARHRRSTLRLPVNVPFIIDNLWEYLRPEHMPCRRHAVYASPSPALALLSCAGADKGLGLGVYEVLLTGDVKTAQLAVSDAKLHSDIGRIVGMLPKRIAELATDAVTRQSVAMLFLPGALKDEWFALASATGAASELIAEMSSMSSFWGEARADVSLSDGEVFFELGESGLFSPGKLLCAAESLPPR